MGQSPVNLALRFILELAALYFIGRWGWTQFDGGLRVLPAIGLPLLAAIIWGTFRVPGDGGEPRVRVPGVLRLAIEAVFFGFATWTLFGSGAPATGWVFGGITLLHYLISYDRLAWLVKQ